ncbi:MAG: hypothetical protein U0670_10845 [Anaerolineae bacterium]
MKKFWIGGLFAGAGLLLTVVLIAAAAPERTVPPTPVSRTGPIEFVHWAASVTPIPTADIYRCPYPLPEGLVQGRMKRAVYAFSRPEESAVTDILIPSGTSWWIMAVEGPYYQLWIACEGSPVWVPINLMEPNNDPVWHGTPLPVGGMALLRIVSEL